MNSVFTPGNNQKSDDHGLGHHPDLMCPLRVKHLPLTVQVYYINTGLFTETIQMTNVHTCLTQIPVLTVLSHKILTQESYFSHLFMEMTMMYANHA